MARFLVIGYGSIGKRHTAILRDMGHEVVTVDPHPEAGADYTDPVVFVHEIATTSTQGGLVLPGDFAGVMDCTPPDVRAGWHYPARARFIEKPLGQCGVGDYVAEWNDNDWWRAIGDYRPAIDASVMMGFCYRWLPSLEGFVGHTRTVSVYSLTMVAGQWLPSWHPNTDYRSRNYWGVILDSLPHSLYIARWILGSLEVIGAVGGHYCKELDIATEDTAVVLLRAGTGEPCTILVDYLRRPRTSYIEAVTSAGVLRWEFDPDEAEEMYRRQMQAWVKVVEGRDVANCPTLADGIAVEVLLRRVQDYVK